MSDAYETSTVGRSSDWRHRALCRDQDPGRWFPVGNGPTDQRLIDLAKAWCSACPVKRDCLEFAMSTRQDHGVWGGLTEQERQSLRRYEHRRARVERGEVG